MKIVSGELKEELFIQQLDEGSTVKELNPANVILKKESLFMKNDLAYIHG